jgi:hypothetical protein
MFRKDIILMLGPGVASSFFFYYFIVTWQFIAPALCIALVIFSFVKYEPIKDKDGIVYPEWVFFFLCIQFCIEIIFKFKNLKSIAVAWLITLSIIVPYLIWVAYDIIMAIRNKTGIKKLFQPASDWGPYLIENRKRAVHLKNLESYHRYGSRIDIEVDKSNDFERF